jgi:hypothetical protein
MALEAVDTPSVRWAGHIHSPDAAAVTAIASAWLIDPAARSALVMTPASIEMPLAVTFQP